MRKIERGRRKIVVVDVVEQTNYRRYRAFCCLTPAWDDEPVSDFPPHRRAFSLISTGPQHGRLSEPFAVAVHPSPHGGSRGKVDSGRSAARGGRGSERPSAFPNEEAPAARSGMFYLTERPTDVSTVPLYCCSLARTAPAGHQSGHARRIPAREACERCPDAVLQVVCKPSARLAWSCGGGVPASTTSNLMVVQQVDATSRFHACTTTKTIDCASRSE